jgi:hypothetical protein
MNRVQDYPPRQIQIANEAVPSSIFDSLPFVALDKNNECCSSGSADNEGHDDDDTTTTGVLMISLIERRSKAR